MKNARSPRPRDGANKKGIGPTGELTLMNRVAHRLTRSLEVKTICRHVTESIQDFFKKFNVAVFLLEKDGLALESLSRGFANSVPRNLRLRIGQGLVGRAVERSQTIVANDVSRHGGFLDYGQASTKSEIAIPLQISRRIVGVLDVQSNEPGSFTAQTLRILELIADRLSVAIHNARLYRNATDYVRDLEVSFAIAQSITSSLDLDDVLQNVVSAIQKTRGYTDCAILLADPEKKELYIRAAHGYSRRIVKNTRLRIDLHEGITGHVAATGRAYYAPDVLRCRYYARWKKSVRSELAVPLKVKGETVGVLDLESEVPDAFTEKDMKIYSIFASQASIAIENARLYNETKILSLTDSLTGIPNRRHFDLVFENEMKKAAGYSRPLSIALVDLDDLKTFNDRYGHQAGDRILTVIAKNLKESVRDTDLVARYGGDEFVIVFPETQLNPSLKVAERVQQAIATKKVPVKNHGGKKVTVSIGIANYPLHARTGVELVKQADRALYRSKTQGKNQIQTL